MRGAVRGALKGGEQGERRDDVRLKGGGSKMGAPLPLEHRMPEKTSNLEASAVPCIISWHGWTAQCNSSLDPWFWLKLFVQNLHNPS